MNLLRIPASADAVETESELAPSRPAESNSSDSNTINYNGHFEIAALVLTGCIVLSGGLMFVLIFSLYFKWRSRKEHEDFIKKCPSLMEEGENSLEQNTHPWPVNAVC